MALCPLYTNSLSTSICPTCGGGGGGVDFVPERAKDENLALCGHCTDLL